MLWKIFLSIGRDRLETMRSERFEHNFNLDDGLFKYLSGSLHESYDWSESEKIKSFRRTLLLAGRYQSLVPLIRDFSTHRKAQGGMLPTQVNTGESAIPADVHNVSVMTCMCIPPFPMAYALYSGDRLTEWIESFEESGATLPRCTAMRSGGRVKGLHSWHVSAHLKLKCVSC